MSEAAPERRTTPAPSSSSSSGGDLFSKKYGPLPGWGWTLVAAGAGIAYILYRKYKNAQAAATQAQSDQSYTASGIDYGPQLATIQEEIQNLQAGKHDNDSDNDTSTGATGQVKVPDVVGKTDTVADGMIKAAGLVVKDVNERKGGSGGGTLVTNQSPSAGTMVAKGSSVSITLASGGGGGKPPPKKPTGPPKKKPPAKGDKGDA